ncbi:MAG TPA: TetR/AcrR family transcriptional regulator [Streptosporangiaceae bacterium]|nr:TetR/AcrR family transcriptional regulator [Streptosporangiaceae bacterium]
MTEVPQAASIWLRPERSAVGRPAQWSRAEITGIALRVADAEGLDAVSMRRVAAEIGTGAASLYRYVENREDLLDLMTDATGAEYEFAPPTGDWLVDLVAFGEQARAIFSRHRWLAGLVMTRPVIGPNGVALIEHFLTLLQAHPAEIGAKMEAFGMLNGITAAFALQEQADPGLQARNLAYLGDALTAGRHPRLTELLTPQAQMPAPEELSGRYPELIGRVMAGLLGPA